MLEVLKQRNKTIDQNNLNLIKPWFDISIIKNQKRIFKWLYKFSFKQVVDSSVHFEKKKSIEYNDFLNYVNNANNLFINKSKIMTEQLKVIRKFRKMINDYAFMNGLYTFTLCINDLFDYVNKHEVKSRKMQAIIIANDYINDMYKRYEDDVLEDYKDNKNLQDKLNLAFEQFPMTNKEVFSPKLTLEALFKFYKMTYSKKYITDKQFNTIYLNTLFFYSYAQTIKHFYTRFLMSLV